MRGQFTGFKDGGESMRGDVGMWTDVLVVVCGFSDVGSDCVARSRWRLGSGRRRR